MKKPETTKPVAPKISVTESVTLQLHVTSYSLYDGRGSYDQTATTQDLHTFLLECTALFGSSEDAAVTISEGSLQASRTRKRS